MGFLSRITRRACLQNTDFRSKSRASQSMTHGSGTQKTTLISGIWVVVVGAHGFIVTKGDVWGPRYSTAFS